MRKSPQPNLLSACSKLNLHINYQRKENQVSSQVIPLKIKNNILSIKRN